MKIQKTNALRILTQNNIDFDLINYQYQEDDLSVEKIAQDNQLTLESIFKTLVLISPSKEILVALVPGDAQLSLKKLAQLAAEKKVELLAVKDLPIHTGYVRGACSPIGMKKQFRTWIDETVLNFPKIYVNAGKRGLLFGCNPQDLLPITKAVVASIVQQST